MRLQHQHYAFCEEREVETWEIQSDVPGRFLIIARDESGGLGSRLVGTSADYTWPIRQCFQIPPPGGRIDWLSCALGVSRKGSRAWINAHRADGCSVDALELYFALTRMRPGKNWAEYVPSKTWPARTRIAGR